MPDYIHYIVNRIVVDLEADVDLDHELHHTFYSDRDDDGLEFEEVRWCDLGSPSWNDTSNSMEVTCPECIRITNAPLDVKSYICYRVLPRILSFFTFYPLSNKVNS